MSRGKSRDDKPRVPIFTAVAAIEEAAAKVPQAPPPTEFWRAIFLDQEIDWSIPLDKRPRPVDLMPRPSGFKDRPVGIESKKYLCSFKATKESEAEYRRLWRDLVLKHGDGNYNFYDTLDADGEHPVSLFGWWKLIFVCREDVEKFELGLDEPLADARLEELELAIDADVARGDARSAEIVAIEYERRGRLVEAKLAADYGLKASSYDKGIWDEYSEDKVSARNVQRRLMALYNRATSRLLPRGYDGSYHSTVDCGEADPKHKCEKCGKAGALGSDFGFAAIRLCYVCRRLPRSEWPTRKPIPSFFQIASSCFNPPKDKT